MTQRELSKIFNKFVGKEVKMNEVVHNRPRIGSYTQVSLADENDPTVVSMRKAAEKNGLKLRLWWPGIMGTMDYRTDRVNAHIEKETDGKYRISNRFNIG